MRFFFLPSALALSERFWLLGFLRFPIFHLLAFACMMYDGASFQYMMVRRILGSRTVRGWTRCESMGVVAYRCCWGGGGAGVGEGVWVCTTVGKADERWTPADAV